MLKLTSDSLRALHLFLMLFYAGLVSAESSWQPVHQAAKPGDVSTWVRPVASSPIHEFKGEVEVRSGLLDVFALVMDVEDFPAWIYQCEEARRLPTPAGDMHWLKIKGIWPASDRDAVVRTTLEQESHTLSVSIYSAAVPDAHPRQQGMVRIPRLESVFLLQPLSERRTRITLQTYVDPGGYIPGWLANRVARRAPLQTLTALRERIRSGDYQLDSVDQLPHDQPGIEDLIFPDQRPAIDIRQPVDDSAGEALVAESAIQ